jgi:hypothetical protein
MAAMMCLAEEPPCEAMKLIFMDMVFYRLIKNIYVQHILGNCSPLRNAIDVKQRF